MSGKNTTRLTRRLFICSSLLILLAAVYAIPHIHGRYKAWLHTRNTKDTVIKYIPHIAPFKSILGKYEQAQVPFMFPLDANADAIVLDHHWTVDLKSHTYRTIANGYKHIRQSDGTYIDVPLHVDETNNKYDTVHTWKQSDKLPPVVPAPPTTKPLPDTLHPAGAGSDAEAKTKLLWQKLRKAKLPHSWSPQPGLTLTILRRSIWVEDKHDSLLLHTDLTCITGPPGIKIAPSDTIRIQAIEPIE